MRLLYPLKLSALVTADACVELLDQSTSSSNNRYLFDINSGLSIKDTRESPPYYGVNDPDNQAYVYLQYVPKFDGLSSLYVRLRDIPDGILLEKDMFPSYSNDGLGSYVRWSQDGKRIAYLWTGTDKKVHLSTVNADGTSKQTDTVFAPEKVPFTINRLLMSEWSADGEYLAVAERGNGNTGFWFWSTNPLKRVNTPFDEQALSRGVWSPTGHTFAAIIPAEQPQLVLMTAGDNASVQTIDLSAGDYEQVSWSPDGEYVMLSAVIENRDDPNRNAYWRHDLYKADGTAVITGIRGNDDKASGDASYLFGPGGSITLTGHTLSAVWRPQGHDWVFATQNGIGDDTSIDMVVLDAGTGQYQTLVQDILPDYVSEIFNNQISTVISAPTSFDSIPEVPSTIQMMIPYWEDGKINVAMIDLATMNRTAIVSGADDLARPNSFFRNPTFWLGSDLGVAAWVTKPGANHRIELRMINTHDAAIHELPFELQAIDQFSRVGQSWAIFVGMQDDVFNLYAFNFWTGDYRELMHDVGGLAELQWSIRIDSQEKIAVVGYLGVQDQVSHYALVSLTGDESSIAIASNGLNSMQWSPDGQQVALIQGISYKDRYLQIVARDGTVLKNMTLTPDFKMAVWIRQWTNCS